MSRLALLATVTLLGGCDAPEDGLDAGARAAPGALLLEDTTDPRRCESIEREAAELIHSAMTCADHDDCEAELGTVVSEAPCLPQLACWLAISTGDRVELDVVLDRLEQLDVEYRGACEACPVATCVDPDLVFAACEGRHCALGVATPPQDLIWLSGPPTAVP